MEGGAWWATVHGVTESDTTERLHFHFILPTTILHKPDVPDDIKSEDRYSGPRIITNQYCSVSFPIVLKEMQQSLSPPILSNSFSGCTGSRPSLCLMCAQEVVLPATLSIHSAASFLLRLLLGWKSSRRPGLPRLPGNVQFHKSLLLVFLLSLLQTPCLRVTHTYSGAGFRG